VNVTNMQNTFHTNMPSVVRLLFILQAPCFWCQIHCIIYLKYRCLRFTKGCGIYFTHRCNS